MQSLLPDDDALAAIMQARRRRGGSARLQELGWYHSFELPGGDRIEGYVSLDELRTRLERMRLPADLTGKRVLDIGAWDGWFSFEMEKRGAHVVAVDCAWVPQFDTIRRKLGSGVDYRIADLYDLDPKQIGRFDIVLFLGVLYHVKHPLLALERVCDLTTDVAIVESFVTDTADTTVRWPMMEFYETDELGGQLDNWFGPNIACLQALCRSAGFARVSLEGVSNEAACVSCFRTWPPSVPPLTAAPTVTAALHSRNFGLNFRSGRDEYIACAFRTEQRDLTRHSVFPRVGAYGVAPVYLTNGQTPSDWIAHFRVPPGLEPGWHDVGIRSATSGWSNACLIALDIPLEVTHLRTAGVCDGITWTAGAITSGTVSLWVEGLPENADLANVQVWIGDDYVRPAWIERGGPERARQVNALAHGIDGAQWVHVSVSGVQSDPVRIDFRPNAPS